MKGELKACWSCGCSDALRFGGLNVGMGGYRHVSCDREKGGCGAMGRSAGYGREIGTEVDAKAKAAEFWNTRPLEAALTAALAALRQRNEELEKDEPLPADVAKLRRAFEVARDARVAAQAQEDAAETDYWHGMKMLVKSRTRTPKEPT